MAGVKEILAKNLKENRQRLGITQPELAERAGMSTQYLAMIEIARKFPAADILDRLAEALGINANELFSAEASPEKVIEKLEQNILEKLDQKLVSFDQVIECAVKKAIEENYSNKLP